MLPLRSGLDMCIFHPLFLASAQQGRAKQSCVNCCTWSAAHLEKPARSAAKLRGTNKQTTIRTC